MSHITVSTQVTYKDLEMHMEGAVELDHPLFIWGASGIGKTAVAESFCTKNDYDFLDLFLVARESIDFGGLPHVVEGRMAFALPTMIPLEGDDCPKTTVVFLDELPMAQPMVQSVCYKLIQERRAGDSKIHKNVRFLLAGNRAKDKGHHSNIPAPLLNRCDHVELKIDTLGWLEYAAAQNIHPAIFSFLKSNPSKLHVQTVEADYASAVDNKAFHTNRSWTRASEKLVWCEKMDLGTKFLQQTISSCIGTGMALTFLEFYKNVARFPAPEEIFAGKGSVTEPIDHPAQYYLAYNILTSMKQEVGEKAEEYREDPNYHTRMENAMAFAEKHFSPEILSTYIALMLQKVQLPIHILGGMPSYVSKLHAGGDDKTAPYIFAQ